MVRGWSERMLLHFFVEKNVINNAFFAEKNVYLYYIDKKGLP